MVGMQVQPVEHALVLAALGGGEGSGWGLGAGGGGARAKEAAGARPGGRPGG